jgi:hypothetical protein
VTPAAQQAVAGLRFRRRLRQNAPARPVSGWHRPAGYSSESGS